MANEGHERKNGNKRNISKWICIGAIIVLVIIVLYNCVTDWKVFLTTNVTSVLSISAVLIVSYYLTQMRNDERKRIDNVERLIIKIQQEIVSEKVIHGKINMCLLYQRSIANKIGYLRGLDLTKINDDLKYIDEQFITFKDLYGSHMNDTDFPESMEQDFQRLIINIIDRCDEMLVDLRK